MHLTDWLFLLASVLVINLGCLSSSTDVYGSQRSPNTVLSLQESRFRRQTRRRPLGFFNQLNLFIRDTVNDTGMAYRNISKIFNDQFTTPAPSLNEIEDTNSTTPRVYTMQELFGILGRNYRGLRRLFNREWTTAVQDSNGNVEIFRKEFRTALKPFFQPNRNITRL